MQERALIRCNPPGAVLRQELLARGWTAWHFAQLLGTSLPTVEKILAAQREISPELALAIGAVLETGPERWLALERQFQLDKARNLCAGE